MTLFPFYSLSIGQNGPMKHDSAHKHGLPTYSKSVIKQYKDIFCDFCP